MAEEIKIVASAVGFDQVNKALDSTTKSLEETSQAATQAGKTLGNQLKVGSGQAQQSLLNLNRVVQDAPYGFIGIANNINPLVESFGRLRAESGSTGGALKALIGGLSGAGGLGLAFAAVTSAITFAQIGFQAWTGSSKQAEDQNNKTTESVKMAIPSLSAYEIALNNIAESEIKNAQGISDLSIVILSNATSIEARDIAIQNLNKNYGEYLSNLDLEIDKNRSLQETLSIISQKQAKLTLFKSFAPEIQDQIKKVNELQIQLEQIKLGDFLSTPEEIAADAAAVQKEINSLVNNITLKIGYIPKLADKLGIKNKGDLLSLFFGTDQTITVKKVIKVKEELDKLTIKPVKVDKIEVRTKELQKQLEESLTTLRPIEIPVLPELPAIPLNFEISQDQLDQLNQVFIDAANNIAVGFGETLGNALSGKASIGDFFKGIFQEVGAAMISFGKLMIKFAIKVETIKKFIIKYPALAIAGGIALIALGTLIRNSTNRPAFAVGTRYAPGGMALVGERGPEMINLPRGSQVIPAAQTSQMMGGIGGAIEVFGMLRGQDIYFSNKKYGQTYKRTT